MMLLNVSAGQNLMFRPAGFMPPPELCAASELRLTGTAAPLAVSAKRVAAKKAEMILAPLDFGRMFRTTTL